MGTQKGMSDYTATYDGTNEVSFNVPGDFIHVQSVSVQGAAVFIRLDDGNKITRFQGQGNRVLYSRVGVSASVACSVTLQLGYGYATDARATFSAGSVEAPIQPALHNVPKNSVSVGAGLQALLDAADPSRGELGLSIDSTQPGGVFIGDNTVASEVGLFIEPGQIVFLSTEAAVYAYNPGGSAVAVRLISMKNS